MFDLQQLQQPQPTFTWKDISSFLALGVSLFTAYYSFFRKGRLKGRLGRVLLVQYRADGKTDFKPEISLVNTGATTAVVYHIFGEIRRLSDDVKETLIWIENLTTEFVPEDRTTDTRFAGFPETFAIAKSEAMKQRLLLATEHPFAIKPGDYEIELFIQSDGAAKPKMVIKSRMRARSEDVEFLETSMGKGAGPGRAWNLRFVFEYGPNTNCYIGRPNSPKNAEDRPVK